MKHTQEDTIKVIQQAIKVLTEKRTKPTQSAIANELNLTTRTIKKYWDRVNLSTDNRVNPTIKKGEPTSTNQGEG